MSRRRRKRWLLGLAAVLAVVSILPAYLRVYRVTGPSEAPSYLVGDRILVNRAAYDLRLPYADVVLLAHSRPRRGDMVLFHPPGRSMSVFKRVVGVPGDTVTVLHGRLEINGIPLRYESRDRAGYRSIPPGNRLGERIEEEAGNGPPHLITRTPSMDSGVPPAPVQVAPGHYFLMGDNRDDSTDSRSYGAVPEAAILGKVLTAPRFWP